MTDCGAFKLVLCGHNEAILVFSWGWWTLLDLLILPVATDINTKKININTGKNTHQNIPLTYRQNQTPFLTLEWSGVLLLPKPYPTQYSGVKLRSADPDEFPNPNKLVCTKRNHAFTIALS